MVQSRPEQAEAWLYGAYGASKGVVEHLIKPTLVEQPVWAYMLCGALGGLAVAKLLHE